MSNHNQQQRPLYACLLLPIGWQGFVLATLAFILPTIYYVWRTQRDVFIMNAGLGLFFIAFPVFLILVPLSAMLLIWFIWYTVGPRGSILPVLVLFTGFFLALKLPLPPSSAETTFYTNRTQYEQVVQIAREQKLGHDENCGYAFALPKEYKALTHECVFMINEPALAIAFSPPTSHRVIAYAEQLEALNNVDLCDGNSGTVYKQLEEQWYLYTPAQD